MLHLGLWPARGSPGCHIALPIDKAHQILAGLPTYSNQLNVQIMGPG